MEEKSYNVQMGFLKNTFKANQEENNSFMLSPYVQNNYIKLSDNF